MKKRSIIGWRQAPPSAPSLRKRATSHATVVPTPKQPPAEPPPKEQWENEGGNVKPPAK